MRDLTPQEACAVYHFYERYASLSIGAIEFYKTLSKNDQMFINEMVERILQAAQQSRTANTRESCFHFDELGWCIHCDDEEIANKHSQ